MTLPEPSKTSKFSNIMPTISSSPVNKRSMNPWSTVELNRPVAVIPRLWRLACWETYTNLVRITPKFKVFLYAWTKLQYSFNSTFLHILSSTNQSSPLTPSRIPFSSSFSFLIICHRCHAVFLFGNRLYRYFRRIHFISEQDKQQKMHSPVRDFRFLRASPFTLFPLLLTHFRA